MKRHGDLAGQVQATQPQYGGFGPATANRGSRGIRDQPRNPPKYTEKRIRINFPFPCPSVLLTLNFFEPCANSWAKTKYEPLSIGSYKLFICQKLNAPNFGANPRGCGLAALAFRGHAFVMIFLAGVISRCFGRMPKTCLSLRFRNEARRFGQAGAPRRVEQGLYQSRAQRRPAPTSCVTLTLDSSRAASSLRPSSGMLAIWTNVKGPGTRPGCSRTRRP